VGTHAPAVLLVAFVPMFLVAGAYKYFNKADPDAGTTFAWTTRAFGPTTGWMNGWAIFLADVIVMVSLSDIAAEYTFKLFGFTELGESKAAIIIAAVIWIMLMTWICYRGIELSAKLQTALLGVEVAILAIFSVVALVKVYGGNVPALHETVEGQKVVYHSIKPTLDWFNPFAMKTSDLVVALLIGFFIYWGWDSGVAVNEESEDPAEGPGKAAVVSTILLVVIYVIVTAAAQSFHGTEFLGNHESDVLYATGKDVLGSTLNKLLIITVLTSASASTQTTILPTARTTLSMAHWKAVTSLLGRVHKRFLTPTVSTLGFGLLSIIITVVILLLSESVLLDSISAVGFPICFYYGFTGVACAVYYRRELGKSVRNFFFLGAGPLIGGLAMFAVGIKAAIYYGRYKNVASKPILHITLPLWMGIGGMVLGLVIMLFSRPVFKEYFSRKPETAPPGILDHPLEAIPPAVDF
jgi:amino acid transporter